MLNKFIAFLKSLFVKPLPPPPVVEEPVRPDVPELPVHSQRVVKLGIIVGHTAKMPGAKLIGTDMYEYQFNKKVAEYLKGMQLDPRVRVDTILRDEIGIAGAYQVAIEIGCDAVIELHFNAFDGKTGGTLTLCTIDDNDVAFAQIVHKKLCEVFKRDGSSLGVRCVSRVDRGAENLHSFPAGVNCLVEPFFGDEMKDALLGASCVEAYAQALVEAVVLWAKQVDLL